MFELRLERGGGQRIFLSCAGFSITQPFLNIQRHAIHQMVSMMLSNSSEIKLKIVNEIEN